MSNGWKASSLIRCFADYLPTRGLVLLILLIGTVGLVACGGESDAEKDPEQEEKVDETDESAGEVPRAVLQIDSKSGCSLDMDCAAGLHCFQGQCAYECDESVACSGGAVCSERGRCTAQPMMGAKVLKDQEDIRTDLKVLNVSDTIMYIKADQTTAEFVLELSGRVPDAGLPYRMERTDDPGSVSRVWRTKGSTKELRFTIPVGQAGDGEGNNKDVKIKLFTPVGNYNLVLSPEFNFGGTYVGTATINTFGTSGLPINFQVVTEPDDATLQDATKAWLVLPVGAEQLFSPINTADPSITYIARELKYDDFVERWVATYDYAFELTAGGAIVSKSSTQVRRSMRFELEPFESGSIIGSFTDRWTGLYETRSAQGVTRLEDVIYDGDLHLSRMGKAIPHAELEIVEHEKATPELLGAPSLAACADESLFDVERFDIDEVSYDCLTIDSSDAFESADVVDQARCSIAMAADALSGDTTGAMIRAFLDDSAPNPNNQSFAEFMEDCAAGKNGTCRPSAEVLCGRQLLSYSYQSQEKTSEYLVPLAGYYESISREAYLGQQLGAFGTDAKLRLSWLQTSDYPAVIVSAVQSLNERLLDDWKEKVLEVHLDVLQGQFDSSGLSMLARQTTDGESAAARRMILTDMTQSWRGSMDALTLATTRWHTLMQADADRASKTDYVSSRMFDLYLSAGVLKNLNRAADAGYLSARLAGGFSSLMRELGKLSMPFDKLIYARDAEVVVNTSVDPGANNQTLLAARKADAMLEIQRAHTSVLEVIESAQTELLNEEQLRNKMSNEINDLRDSLVEMCGLPNGCNAESFRTDSDCLVRVEAGQCGFALDKTTEEITSFSVGQQSVSEAGQMLLGILEAAQNIAIADEEVHALAQRTSMQYDELEAFEKEIIKWNTMRLAGVLDLKENLETRETLRNETVQSILDNFAQRAEDRQASIEDSRETFENWNRIRVGDATKQLGMLISASAARGAADHLRNMSEGVKDFAEAAADGVPKVVGVSSDATFAARLAMRMSAANVVLGMRNVATGLDSVAVSLEIARESYMLMQDAKMAEMQDQAELDDMIGADELETLKEEVRKKEMMTDAEIARLKEVIELAEATRQADLAYDRDMDTFRQRRLDIEQKVVGLAGLEFRIEQAKIQYEQSVARYLQVVQSATLQNAKFQDLLSQRDSVNQLVGSPAVIFGRANRVEQAELRLERAKSKLMDWLVALEYYAVRPFMDQRMQILLARNTYQLEKIAEELSRLERQCGGSTNANVSTISVRRDLMGLTESSVDPVSRKVYQPEERFREVLSNGHVPIDKRVRYSTDDTIGSLMGRDPDVLAATFFIDLNNFANLELTCNAKIGSLAVNLVGDVGSARPTVSILYDGTSKLRSCQPGIESYVSMLGADTTSYGKITHLRTLGRSMSPVAGINAFENDLSQASSTFNGLPLASQYTVLIDKSAGENRQVDWSKLEDIELQLTYSYQDVFPVGQCE